MTAEVMTEFRQDRTTALRPELDKAKRPNISGEPVSAGIHRQACDAFIPRSSCKMTSGSARMVKSGST